MVCPNRQELSDFALGKLGEDAIETVSRHLDECPSCQTTIAALAVDDTFLAGLKQVRKSEPEANRGSKIGANPSPPPPAADKIGSAAAPTSAPHPTGVRPMTIHCEAFVQAALHLGLIDETEASSLTSEIAPEKRGDAQAAAKLLVERGKLTKYQAAAIYQGKAGTLSYGDYLVLDRIGAGGMGQVFKARHRRMDRLVALKVMSPATMNNADAVKRFEREVKAAAKLSHPNIVTAYDAGAQDGVHYLVMELVDGPDLSSLLKKHGKLPVKNVTDFIAQAAQGLAFAHGKGVVHRDIKPGNLLVDSSGKVKILDLGLARVEGPGASTAKHEAELTQSGAVMGTVDYMAPEQALNTRHADAKSDVYSLGCSLYRLLTGEPLYGGETMVEKILAHRDQPVPPLRQVRPEVPPALEAIYQRMVAKKPDQRPTMQEIADALGSLESASATGMSGLNLAAVPMAAVPQAYSVAPMAPSAVPAVAAPAPAIATREGQAPRNMAAPRTKGVAPPRRNSRLPLLAAAGAGAVLVALGVWFIFRDAQNNETARIQLPDGGTVQVVDDEETNKQPVTGPSATPRPSGTDATRFFTPPPSAPTPSGTSVAPSPPAVAVVVPDRTPTSIATPPVDGGGNRWLIGDPQRGAVPCVTIPGIPLDPTVPLTIEAWVVPSLAPLNPATAAHISEGRSLPVFGFERTSLHGGMQFAMNWNLYGDPSRDRWVTAHQRPSPTGRSMSSSQPVAVVTRDVPTHLALVVEPKTGPQQKITVWINGKSVKTIETELYYDPGYQLFSHGFLDELRVSKSLRYNAEFTPVRRFEPDADTLALYHCDEGSGTQLVDAGGSRRHGVLSADARWLPLRGAAVVPPAVAVTPPPVTSAAGDLYVYTEDLNTQNAPILVDGSLYDGTTPLTIEAWAVPKFSPQVLQKLLDDKQMLRPVLIFGLNHTVNPVGASQHGIQYDIFPDPEKDRWNDFTVRQNSRGGYYGGKGNRNVPTHVAIVVHAPVDGKQQRTVWVDGRGVRMTHDTYLYQQPMQLLSHGYFSELRLSKVARYTADFTPQRRFEPDADTIALYHADEGAGTQLIDSSGNGRHGRLTNVKWAALDGAPPVTAITQPAASPTTTGPTTTGPVDLLALIQPSRDTITGQWTRNGTALHGTGEHARILVPYTPRTPEYDVVFTGRRTEIRNRFGNIFIGVIGGGKPCFMRVSRTQVGFSDGDSAAPPNFAGDLNLNIEEPCTIVCAVRRDSVRLDVNGRTALTYRGDFSDVIVKDPPPRSDQLFLQLEDVNLEVTSLQFVTVAANSTASPQIASGAPRTNSAGGTVRFTPNQERLLRSGLIVTGYDRAASQSTDNGGYVPRSSFTNPVPMAGNPFVIASLEDWKYPQQFNAVAEGYLKIDVPGEYQFKSVNFYDRNVLMLNGREVCRYSDGEGTIQRATLEAGYVPIASIGYVMARGNVEVAWMPPGKTTLTAIPPQLLFHLPPNVKLPPGPATTVATTTPITPPITFAPPPPVSNAPRKPVPETKLLAEATTLIKDIFKDDYAEALKQPEKKSPLAHKLLQEAAAAGNEPAQSYALLDEAKKLAADSGDVLALRTAVERQVREFEVDAAAAHVDAWDELLRKPRQNPTIKQLHDEAVVLFAAAVSEGRLDDAKRYADFALGAARRLKDVNITKDATDRNTALAARRTEWDVVKAAAEKLAEMPDDAAANLAVGRYRVFVENDWARGLPLLAKGNDETLKQLAEKSLAAEADSVAVADAWWDAAQTASATRKAEFYAGAALWYRQAISSATGLQKTRIEKRLNDAAASVPAQKIPPTRLASLP